MTSPTLLTDSNAVSSPLLTGKTVFVETLGCQMNVNDSELMMGLLEAEGLKVTFDPLKADLLMINTCQIRGHSEDKAYSYLGKWGALKRQRPHIKIAMAGCVAQQAKDSVFKRAPYVDMVVGTQNIADLPAMVKEAFAGGTHILRTDRQKDRSTYDFTVDVAPRRDNTVSAWVTIIEGCDYFCTYCVVPYTRGRQISRSSESILAEVKDLAGFGFKEITLLGQTVDSYGRDFKDQQYGLANLLHELNDIDGLERIRFMTSHPLDMTDAIIDAIADLPKVMEYIHIPMQSGDDTVLERMKRGYTSQQYFDLVDKIRDRVPNVGISGDYIVGFPGETDAQFEKSVESVTRTKVNAANTAAYSARKQTPAGLWEEREQGAIPDSVKQERLKILNDAITAQTAANNRAFDGQTVEVLVEGRSRRNPDRLMGRMRNNTVVNLDPPPASPTFSHEKYTWVDEMEHRLVGKIIPVTITEPFPYSLVGQVAESYTLPEAP
ncbi:MAG: tRNA (N6-isopentenyl adenosine(37)-C2)-methylthiotransferase MiaB [Vampirovibrionales bacterium]|nr:tRNA (N6-isopentenyl adenosine(37)-C2)-methylthiotransferase MiaB [Vampirovibrionales bacterium]